MIVVQIDDKQPDKTTYFYYALNFEFYQMCIVPYAEYGGTRNRHMCGRKNSTESASVYSAKNWGKKIIQKMNGKKRLN